MPTQHPNGKTPLATARICSLNGSPERRILPIDVVIFGCGGRIFPGRYSSNLCLK
jgi:hypothetical protein